MVCIESHNPRSSPYPATAAQQVTACSLSYSTSDHHVQCRAAMPHLLCRATQSWGVQLVTKNDEGVKWNRPINLLHWPLTHYYTACVFHAHFMHYTESDDQKLGGGPTHCWSPGDLSPPVAMVVAPMVGSVNWVKSFFHRANFLAYSTRLCKSQIGYCDFLKKCVGGLDRIINRVRKSRGRTGGHVPQSLRWGHQCIAPPKKKSWVKIPVTLDTRGICPTILNIRSTIWFEICVTLMYKNRI